VSAVPHRPGRYGDDAVRFSGEADALFERHLRFDSVVDPAAAGARDRFEAAAHAVRDILTQRWIQTQQAYDRENPKRVYYLSM
jgi:starch phosphorylase